MKPALKSQLSQQLHLTPQLLQSIRLLQLDAQQLQQEIALALETNPLLECEEPGDGSDGDVLEALGQTEAGDAGERALDEFEVIHEAFEDDGFSAGEDWAPARQAFEGDDDPMQRLGAGPAGLRASVLEQLLPGLRTAAELDAAAWLVEQVDERGYLGIDPATLRREARRLFGLDGSRIECLRQRMLRGEPCGYGAIDLAECLRVQLEELAEGVPGRALALRIVNTGLERLAAGDTAGLCRSLGVTLPLLQQAQRLILGLQPRPGERLPEDPGHYIVPDVRVVQRNGRWQAALNHATAPRLRVNPEYERLLAGAGDGQGAQRLRELMSEARWLTRGLAMRYDTLQRTAAAIVERQQGFLERGEEALLPMTLREIADAIGMHESTISRITNGKYIQTPRGTFELKFFFSARLDGAAVANTAVRAMVRRLIEGESPAAPLADDTIALLLARQGIRIARRTVAKYRDQLGIGSARQRHGSHLPALARAG